MNLAYTEEQKLLADSVSRYVEKEYGFEARKKWRDSELGWSRDNWRRFAELGWLAAPFAESDGGLGGGPVEAAIVMEGVGKGLVVEPYLAGIVLAGSLLAAAGRRDVLEKVLAGEAHAALAYVERQARYDLADVETTAQRQGGGFVLKGRKGVVFNAHAADWFIVPARTAGGARERQGITLFLVPKGAKGLSLRPYRTIDGQRAAEVALDGVAVGGEPSLAGELDRGLPLLEAAIDRAAAAACAEAAAIMNLMTWTTRDYLKTRHQFGVPLASFQALQHRAADMFVLAEQATGMAYMAAVKVASRDPAQRARAVSAAKAWIGRAGRKVGQEAIQMHGGMGMTDELPITHYFRRLTMIDTQFGDAAWHKKRFAALPAETAA